MSRTGGPPLLSRCRFSLEQALAQAERQIEIASGHRFALSLAADLAPHQLRQIAGVLPMLSQELAALPAHVDTCEVGARPDDMKVTFAARNLVVEVGPGWAEPGDRRRIMDAVGLAPPAPRFEHR
jgi:hypothetical protein